MILHNVVDLTDVLTKMGSERAIITKDLVGSLSPYMRDHIRRYGRYDVEMNEYPQNPEPNPVPISA